ncbi:MULTISPECIES: hypothetical protein [unclassified Beijerinckia]|uniref:SecDF P1 head subdomain-containing protein n=1 Tax=unclassified Beijerinckia TaxID=2638183 RepID=UPI00089A35ED|nr:MULTISPECIES: hypothetical protein [unclassified Beijerinckia]MDH7794089.1 preprotein translocase subunit SecD [Beijerinckia sp. GAS462]SEB53076.1 preprotein translocase subunit SecD [Beijerinckia sp. 28-YEA-48]
MHSGQKALYLRRTAMIASALVMTVLAHAPALADPLSLSITKAQATTDPKFGTPVLNVELTPESSKAFATWTSNLVGKQITISIDGKIVVSPTIRTPILGGALQISGVLELKQLQELAKQLTAGTSRIEADVKAN